MRSCPKRLHKGLSGHAPCDHRVQIVELFENTACDCYFNYAIITLPKHRFESQKYVKMHAWLLM